MLVIYFKNKINSFTVILILLLLESCTQQQQIVAIELKKQETIQEYKGLKRKVAIGRFSNETQYAKGIFYDKTNDPLGKQALDILSAKLSLSNKFILLERSDMDKITEELKLARNDEIKNIGADYLIIGSVTEFGRKIVGDVNAFSRSKTQTVQAGVNIRLVDVLTGQIIYSEEAKGEAETTNKTVMGMGERADFDATLSDKAISAAITKLVDNIINNCLDRPWKSYILSTEENEIIIAGGKSQGIKIGELFDVYEKGKSVKNPQTGLSIELPGKSIGKIKIKSMGGDNPENEFSIGTLVEGKIEDGSLEKYLIREIKNENK
jgi:curli biogenesis system outer membrane secretion channel CsgG